MKQGCIAQAVQPFFVYAMTVADLTAERSQRTKK